MNRIQLVHSRYFLIGIFYITMKEENILIIYLTLILILIPDLKASLKFFELQNVRKQAYSCSTAAL